MRKNLLLYIPILILILLLAGCGSRKPDSESSVPSPNEESSNVPEESTPEPDNAARILGNWYCMVDGSLTRYCFFPDGTCVIVEEEDTPATNTFTWALYKNTLRLTDPDGYSRLITIQRISDLQMRWFEDVMLILLRTSPYDPDNYSDDPYEEESSEAEESSGSETSYDDSSSRDEQSKQEESSGPPPLTESFLIGTWESNNTTGRSKITIRADHTGSMTIPLYWFPIDFEWTLSGNKAEIRPKSFLISGTYALEILSYEQDHMTIVFNGAEMEAYRIE